MKGIPTIFTTGLFLFFMWLLFFVSLLQNQESFFYLALFLLIVVYGNRLWSYLSPYGVKASLQLDKRHSFPGTTIGLKIIVKNKKILPVRVFFAFPGVDKGLTEESLVGEASLLSYQNMTWDWSLTPVKRGCYLLGKVVISSADLPGLFFRRIESFQEEEIIVYPRTHSLKKMDFIPYQLGNQEVKNLIRDYTNPIGTREYSPSHPARFINWKATARHGFLQENIFAPAGSQMVLFIIEVDHWEEESFEVMLEGVASLALALDSMGYSISLITNSRLMGKGERSSLTGCAHQLQSILETLARIQREPMDNLLEILDRIKVQDMGKSTFLFTAKGEGEVLGLKEYLASKGLNISIMFPQTIEGFLFNSTYGNARS